MKTLVPQTVRFGDRSTAVARLQRVLGLKTDGIFGAVTLAALTAFQRNHGLSVDGVAGPATWAVLLSKVTTENPMQNAYTQDLDDAFFPKLLEVCSRIECDPEDLLGVMMSESGIKATAHNPAGDASGLIQFMPGTLKAIHFPGSSADLRALSATAQLEYVEDYYQAWKNGRPWSMGKLYQATFLPGTLTKSNDPEQVICIKGGKLGWAYDANPGFDRAKKGYITVGDLQASVRRACTGPRWAEVMARLVVAGAGDAA